MKTLKDALIGETVVVKKISGEPVLKRGLWIWELQKTVKFIFVK